MGITSVISGWFKTILYETYHWFLGLDPQEWFVALALVTLFGGLCMKGFGSRGRA